MSLRTRTVSLLAALGLVAAVPLGVQAPAGAAGPLPTSTKVTASATSVIVGTPVTLTAKVSILNLGGLILTPTGSVAFSTSTGGPATGLGSAPLSSGLSCVLTSCTATLTTSALPVGTNTVAASYAGDLLGAASAGTTTVQVAPPPDTAPSAPTLTATSQVGSIQLHWTSASDGGQPITGYAIQRGPAATGPFTTLATGLPTGDYQDTTVVIGTTYFYRATSANAIGTSGFSNVASSAATSNGAGTFSTTACPAGSTCSSPTSTFVDGPTTTTISATTEASTSPHTLTVTIGGPPLAACAMPGPSATFNDTSGDAFKQVVWKVTGQVAADAAYQQYFNDTTYVGCLGLDHPWFRGSPSVPAIWFPADGLYEGKPATCVNSGAFFLGGGHFSQPCTSAVYQHLGNATDYFQLTYNLPPGDGRISGGS
ncbi:Ig-like domain repeat protein [Marmoricola sp. RAF53]|uniref:Ig-like domain-containing protein n=1 Tax=Marmoricola sp. RAF53 TaxID=3233059 RepID=UPI003F95E3EE